MLFRSPHRDATQDDRLRAEILRASDHLEANRTLICFMLNIPGPEKVNELFEKVFYVLGEEKSQ